MRKSVAFLVGLVSLTGLLAAGCNRERPVQFGAVLPLTGDKAIYGVPIRNGIELAAERIRQDPELAYPFELTILDSQSDPQRATELLKQLYREQNALAVIGGVTTDSALAMVSAADEADRILLSPSASSPQLTGISHNFFRIFPSDFKEGTKMGNFAAGTLGAKTAVILAAESPYARGIQEVFKTEFERQEGEVLEVIEYPQVTTEFGDPVRQAVELKPEAIYVADYADQIVRVLAELRAQNYRGRILTTSAFNTPTALEEAGDQAEGVLLTQALFDPESEDPKVQSFLQAYREKYGEMPGLYAAHGYDAMMTLAEVLGEVGRRPTDFPQGIRGLRNYSGVTGPIQFDEKGDVQRFPRVYILQGGSTADYDKVIEAKREQIRRQLEDLRRRTGG
jgi:branched-chain amino acid transport system substrate-binding protein